MKHSAIKASLLCIFMLIPLSACSEHIHEFAVDKEKMLVPYDEIHSGGPPKDGIPAIDKPKFLNSVNTEIKYDDKVLGLDYNGIAKAYPISVLNWHEIVNDRYGNEPVVITYCPLCGSGAAFLARVKDRDVTFGVSGLLYNSDVLLYDRQTESLWSQLMKQAVTGPMRGTELKLLPMIYTVWGKWIDTHPDSVVLSRATGFRRDYDRDPYAGYENSEGIWFPVKKRDNRFHPKEQLLGLEIDGKFKAYPFSELSKNKGDIKEQFGGQEIVVRYDKKNRVAEIHDTSGATLPAIRTFWFAWYAFHPDTAVYRAK